MFSEVGPSSGPKTIIFLRRSYIFALRPLPLHLPPVRWPMMPSSSLLKLILAQLKPILEPSWPQLGLFRPPRTFQKLSFPHVFLHFCLSTCSASSSSILRYMPPSSPHLGPILGHLGPFLGPSWAHLGPNLGPSWPPWALLGASVGRLGAVRPTSFN